MRFRPRFSPFIALCAAVVVLSLALPLPSSGAILGLPSPCGLMNLTGIPCPGCGLTRSFVCCGHGHLAEAFVWHPLGPPLFVATLLTVGGALLGFQFKPKNGGQLLAGVLLTFGVFWMLRLGGVFPLPKA
ncbi:DUF2752 domain-containing protein [bacterium]|nr:MAG: DUF2752 domain-containing protein [bacterium]